MAALNFILNCRVMEQSGADENYIGGILACLGAQNTIQGGIVVRILHHVPQVHDVCSS